MRTKKNSFHNGDEIIKELGKKNFYTITHHNMELGGTNVLMYGGMGMGKSTAALWVAEIVNYGSDNKPETVIWRGRDPDYWNLIEGKKVYVHLHEKDTGYWKRDDGSDYGRDINIRTHKNRNFKQTLVDNDQIIPYKNFEELLHHLEKTQCTHSVNAIYYPREYKVSREFYNTLETKLTKKIPRGEVLRDEAFWWIEFFLYIVKHKQDNTFISIILDEVDDIIAYKPAGIRYHAQMLLKDAMKDFRKQNISMYLICHQPSDIDPLLLNKVYYSVPFGGGKRRRGSLLHESNIKLQDRGNSFVEGDTFGTISWGKRDMTNKVRVSFTETEELRKRLRENELAARTNTERHRKSREKKRQANENLD